MFVTDDVCSCWQVTNERMNERPSPISPKRFISVATTFCDAIAAIDAATSIWLPIIALELLYGSSYIPIGENWPFVPLCGSTDKLRGRTKGANHNIYILYVCNLVFLVFFLDLDITHVTGRGHQNARCVC